MYFLVICLRFSWCSGSIFWMAISRSNISFMICFLLFVLGLRLCFNSLYNKSISLWLKCTFVLLWVWLVVYTCCFSFSALSFLLCISVMVLFNLAVILFVCRRISSSCVWCSFWASFWCRLFGYVCLSGDINVWYCFYVYFFQRFVWFV